MTPTLREAAELALSTLTDPRIGQWQYMEGSEIYEDFDEAIQALRTALAVPAQGDDARDARRYRAWRAAYVSGKESQMLNVLAGCWDANDLDAAIDAALASQENDQ